MDCKDSKKSLTISDLEELLVSSVKIHIEIASKEKPCNDLGIKADNEMANKYRVDYDFSDHLIARLNSYPFWYLTLGENAPYNKAIIPSDGEVRWNITKDAESLSLKEIQTIAKSWINNKEILSYLKENLRLEGYSVIDS